MSKIFSKKSRAFTLIELLVVIAIIVLLAAIILTALARYRDRAKDARIQAVLSKVRNEAEIIENDTNSYTSLCVGGALNEDNSNLKTIKEEIEKFSDSPTCYASDTEYCVEAKLVRSGYYCIDSTGIAVINSDSYCVDANKKCPAP